MQSQGTDGLSRGDTLTGVMQGQSNLMFVPLHLSACERSPGIVNWCASWLQSNQSLHPLTPEDWFMRGHGITGWESNPDGIDVPIHNLDPTLVYLWHPPPAAADVAIEQLAFSQLKHPGLSQIFLCPRLMTHLWRKKLFKLADIVFTLPVGVRPDVWPSHMFEPLVVGIILPHLLVAPWSCRFTPTVLAMGCAMSSVWATVPGDECSLLWQLWDAPGGGEI